MLKSRLKLLSQMIHEKDETVQVSDEQGFYKNVFIIRIRRDDFSHAYTLSSSQLITTDLKDLSRTIYNEFVKHFTIKVGNKVLNQITCDNPSCNFEEVYQYKKFILSTRDYKKGKEILDDAVTHGVLTQREYLTLTGYTDGLRDGGK